MAQNKSWGERINPYSVHPSAIHMARKLLLSNNENYMKNIFENSDLVSSEEVIVDEYNNVFQKRIAFDGTKKQAEFFEVLLAVPGEKPTPDGKYVRFEYRPFIKNGVFENVIFRDFENGEVLSCTAYSDEDIAEMLAEDPENQLIQIMNLTIESFNNIQSNKKNIVKNKNKL